MSLSSLLSGLVSHPNFHFSSDFKIYSENQVFPEVVEGSHERIGSEITSALELAASSLHFNWNNTGFLLL